MQADKLLSGALTGRIAEAIRFEATLLALACIERFVGMPEPAVLVGIPVGEVAKCNEKISLGVRERATQTIVIEYRMRNYKKVRVFTVRFPVRLRHNFH